MKAPTVVGCAVGLAALYLSAGGFAVGLAAVTGGVLLVVAGRRRPRHRRVRRRRVWSDEERRFILDRDGWACVYCGSTDELEIDHIVPFSRGGACSADNAQVLCGPCNRAKGAS